MNIKRLIIFWIIVLTISGVIFLISEKEKTQGATSVIYPYSGGTGTSSTPSYGDILVGNSGGTYTLTTTSSLGISSSPGGSGTPGGSDTQVQFNTLGVFGGDSGLTFNSSTDRLTATYVSSTVLSTGFLGVTSGLSFPNNSIIDAMIASAGTWNAKEPAISAGTINDYWRGDKTWAATSTLRLTKSQITDFGTYDNVVTAGDGLTRTVDDFNLDIPVLIASGGTGLTSFTANSIFYSNNTGALIFTSTSTLDIGGNAGTATALIANGTNAPAGNAILGVDASGAAEGAFDVWTEAENTSAAYLASITVDSPLSGAGTSASHLVISTAGTWSGLAGTATALATNGANCIAGSYPLGVNASGAVEDCTAISGTSFTGMLSSAYYTTNGSTTSTLRSNALYIATSTANMLGLFNVDSSGNVSASGTLQTFGLSTLTGGFISNASSTIGDGTQIGGLTISGGATTTGNAYFASNVGIGTTAPTSEFHIKSTRTTGLAPFFQIEAGKAPTQAASVAFTRANNTQQALLAFETTASNNPDGYIGTIGGVEDRIFTITNTGGTGFAIDATYGLAIGTLAQLSSASYTGVTTKFDLSGNGYFAGNVGIGTSTPSQNFSVQGNSYISGTGFFGGALTGTSTLSIGGLSDFTGGFISNASSSISAGLQVAGALNASSSLFVNNSIFVNQGSGYNSGRLTVDSSGNLSTSGTLFSSQNFKQSQYTITVPTTVGNAVEFAQITNPNFSENVEIWMTIHDGSFAQSKRYIAPVFYNATVGAWQKMLPISTTGVYSGNNAEIDVRIANAFATFRVRRQAGTIAGTAYITVLVKGDEPNTTVSSTSATFTGASSAANYAPTSLVMLSGKTGVNNDVPSAYLDVIGTTEQLRVGYNTSNYLSVTVGSQGTTTLNAVGTSPIISIPGASAVTGEYSLLRLGDNSTGFSGSNDANATYLIEQKGTSYGVNGGGIVTYTGVKFGFAKEGTWNKSDAPSTGITGSFVVHTSSGGSGSSLPTVSEKFRVTGAGRVGVGTSTPFAKLSVHALNGGLDKMLFVVASSTQATTNTLFSVDNIGNVVMGSTTITGAFFQTGLPNCNADTDAVMYNATTGKFECGDDDTGGTSFTGMLSSAYYTTNGSTTSTLRSNALYIATSTANMLGLFNVDSSGNVSASGTLRIFGLSTLANLTATNVTSTNIESTNMPTVGGTAILTSLTAPQFTTIELGHASDTTISRVSAGVIAVEGNTVARSVDVQTFTANGTWTKPANAKWVKVTLIGGGGGGGSGAVYAAAAERNAGGGGQGGMSTVYEIPASVLGTTETVTVGTGGAGGVAQTTDSNDGYDGNFGTTSTFGVWLGASGGDFGERASATSGGLAGSRTGMLFGMWSGADGGDGDSAGNLGEDGDNDSGLSGAYTLLMTHGGGAGGGLTIGNATSVGGKGGGELFYINNKETLFPNGSYLIGGTFGTASGGAGGNGNGTANLPMGGSGGGGGGSGDAAGTVNGGTGGNGGIYGAGGGGGGGATNGADSGAGGNGADGIVVVVTYF